MTFQGSSTMRETTLKMKYNYINIISICIMKKKHTVEKCLDNPKLKYAYMDHEKLFMSYITLLGLDQMFKITARTPTMPAINLHCETSKMDNMSPAKKIKYC